VIIKKPKTFIRDTVKLFSGQVLANRQIVLLSTSETEPREIVDEKNNILELWIPLPYWRHNPNRLAALLAHECVRENAADFSPLENKYLDALHENQAKNATTTAKKQTAVRLLSDFAAQGIIVDKLRRKLKVDAEAIALLRQHLWPETDYLAFLTTEMERVTQLPQPLNHWFSLMTLVRISMARQLIADPSFDYSTFANPLHLNKSSS